MISRVYWVDFFQISFIITAIKSDIIAVVITISSVTGILRIVALLVPEVTVIWCYSSYYYMCIVFDVCVYSCRAYVYDFHTSNVMGAVHLKENKNCRSSLMFASLGPEGKKILPDG